MRYRLGDICTITKGETGIMKAIAGEYTMVALGEADKTHNEFQFDTQAAIIPLVSSTGHGHASMKRVKYQEGKFALGNILCAVIPKDENVILAKYLQIYLHWNKEELLVSQMKGMANVSLSMSKIADVEVIVPTIEKQKQILVLEQFLNKKEVETTKHYVHQLALIENLNQAILQEAVQGKLLAKANDEILFSFPPVKAGGNSGGDSMNSPHFQMGGNNMGANFQMGENNEMGENNMGENNKMNKSHFQMGKNNETGQQLLECIKAEKAKSFPLRGNKKVVLPPIKPEEIPFEIPENWVWCRLGEITNIQRGKSPNYSETGIFKMLNQKCVRWYNVDLQYCKSINEEWFDSISENFKVKENDVLVNSTGDGTIGRSAIAHKEVEGYIFDSHILRISSRINQLLICYYINSNYGQALVESTKGATSTKQTELGATNLANFVFPLPPLSEQKLIVAEIERQLAKTKALKAQIASNQANTEALLKALLSRAFEVVTSI